MRPHPTRRHRRRRLVALLAVLVVATTGLAAWWLQDDEDDEPGWLAALAVDAGLGPFGEGARSSSTPPGEQPTRPGAGTDRGGGSSDGALDEGPGTGTIEVVTVADVEPFLVRGADLPLGWVVIESGRPPDGGLGSCIADVDDTVRARVTFQHGTDGAVLSNVVADHRTTDAARSAFDAIRDQAVACVEQADEAAAQARRSSVETSADESFAVALTVEEGSAAVEGRLVYVRVGRYTASLLVLARSAEQTELADRALDVVVERLTSS